MRRTVPWNVERCCTRALNRPWPADPVRAGKADVRPDPPEVPKSFGKYMANCTEELLHPWSLEAVRIYAKSLAGTKLPRLENLSRKSGLLGWGART